MQVSGRGGVLGAGGGSECWGVRECSGVCVLLVAGGGVPLEDSVHVWLVCRRDGGGGVGCEFAWQSPSALA